MNTRNAIAIDLGRSRLRAILADVDGRRLRVKRVLAEGVPESLEVTDGESMGAWVGQRLRRARFPKSRATIAVAREHVVLKRLNLPTSVQDELPEMTRLAMVRDLPFDAEQAVIDFIPVDRGEHSTTVMAVAAPESIVTFARTVAEVAGHGIERISLRNMGTAALLVSLDGAKTDRALAVDITGETVEFSVIVDGAIRFSRAAEIAQDDTGAASGEAVTTETRRTWMSYRIVEDSVDVERAVILGGKNVCEEAAGEIGQVLGVPADVLSAHPRVEVRDSLHGLWPLAGLLLERALGGPSIDLANPRRPPDLAARRRQHVLLGVGAAVVAIAAVWTGMRLNLVHLESRRDAANARVRNIAAEYARFQRDELRLEHLTRWEGVQPAWLDHVAYLATQLPPASEIVLDSFSGSLEFAEVQYRAKETSRNKKWFVRPELTIILDGEARDRAIADALRERLVNGRAYTAKSSGADARGGRRLPVGFTYRLRSKRIAPPTEETESPELTSDEPAATAAGEASE